MPTTAPPAEVPIDRGLARLLLAEQFPDLATLPLRTVGHGWDNQIFRLGEELALRLPRRASAAALVLNEQQWLPRLAPNLPLPIPSPLHCGRPSSGYPWAWSVVPWCVGENALEAPPDGDTAIRQLAEFLLALHRPAPRDAPPNPLRGVALPRRDRAFREHLELVDEGTLRASGVDRSDLMQLWCELRDAPPWQGPAVWLHGDLHLLNLLVQDERLSAVIDFGDVTSGDPATDLAVAWMLFGSERREQLRASTDYDESTWRRARGWALAFAVVYLAHSADPSLASMGRLLLPRVSDG